MVFFGLPAAATPPRSNNVAVSPQFKYVGNIVQADEGGGRLGSKLKFYKSLFFLQVNLRPSSMMPA